MTERIETTDLPDALVKQLKLQDLRGRFSVGRPMDVFSEQLLALVEMSGEPVNLNQLLIAGWRKYGVIWNRKNVRNRMSELVKAGKVLRVKGGIYQAKTGRLA